MNASIMRLLVYFFICISIQLSSAASSTANNCIKQKQSAVYDYIVIGSGPGGTTIATRLALNNYKVLLIEAGPDEDSSLTRTPVLWPEIQLNPAITAQFDTYLYAKADKVKIEYPRGITLGGSAQINAMIIMALNPSEWDSIAQVTNDPNWSYTNIQKKYQPLVENCEYCTYKDANKNGWLNISMSNNEFFTSSLFNQNAAVKALLKTVSSQMTFNPDVGKNNTYDSYFYTPKSVSQKTGLRSGTYRRIKNVQTMKKSNFDVWTNSFVTKLIIDPTTKEACGVEYTNGSYLYKAISSAFRFLFGNTGKSASIYAKREIIVSGGQWMSPQLLQLSGIGDKTLLNQLGIQTIQDLPGVGKNQQDRNEIPYVIKLKTNPNLPGPFKPNCVIGGIIDNACLIGSIGNTTDGLLTSNTILFSMLRSAPPVTSGFPDSVLSFSTLKFTGFRENWVLDAFPYTIGSYLSVNINYARVQSDLGTVRIQSTNPFDIPLIETNHLKGPNSQTEMNKIIDHIRFIRKLLSDPQFSQYIDQEVLPGPSVTTDQQLKDYITKYVWGHHACCTNKMGNLDTDASAVVNSKGQVKGIKNLRIADISIFPKIPGYFPFLPITIACEKIADDIVQQAGRSS